jgi:AcrR family transcriptional regulator
MEVLFEVGYQRTTVSLIGQRAAVSKSDFYRHFESKDDCFFAAYEVAIERIREQMLGATDKYAEGEWSARICDAIGSLLSALAADRALASIALVEGLRAGQGVYDRYQAAIESFVVCLREGAPKAPDGSVVPEAIDEAVVGGVASLLGRRVLAGEAEQIEQLLPAVLELALAPYLGIAEARRIISAG